MKETMEDLQQWVLTAPVGEARAVAFRADGNDVVTVKQYVNASAVKVCEMQPAAFRKFCGITKRRVDEPQTLQETDV